MHTVSTHDAAPLFPALPATPGKPTLGGRLFVAGLSLMFLHNVLYGLGIEWMVIYYSCEMTMGLSILAALRENALNRLNRGAAHWFLLIVLSAGFMCGYGILKSAGLTYLSRDIWPFFLLGGFLVGADPRNWRLLDRMIYWQFAITIPLVAYAWHTWGFQIDRLRLGEVSEELSGVNLYKAWIMMGGWPYLLLTLSQGDRWRKAVTIFGLALVFVLAILFGKREPFLTLGLVALFSALLWWRRTRLRRWRMGLTRRQLRGALIMVATTLLIIGGSAFIFDKVEEEIGVNPLAAMEVRFLQGGTASQGQLEDFLAYQPQSVWEYVEALAGQILKDDRVNETPRLIMAQAYPFEYLIGQGLGSTIYALGRPDVRVVTVENGLASLFFKGGVLFLLVFVAIAVPVVRNFLKDRHPSRRVQQVLVLITFVKSPLAPLFISFPTLTGYLFIWLGICHARSLADRGAPATAAETVTSQPSGHQPPGRATPA